MSLPGFCAGGNIGPSKFVKLSTAADNKVLQAGAGEMPIGVSQRGTRNAPYSSLDDGYAAISGENLQVHGPGELAVVECGGTVTAGTSVKSDGSGDAVDASAGDKCGGFAHQSRSDGQLVLIFVHPHELET